MTAIDDILGSLPIDQLAAKTGAQPDEVRRAAESILPALLGGIQANAQDPAGAESLEKALHEHDNDLAEGRVDIDQVDERDGSAIASNVFGANEEQVVQKLGAQAGGQGLVAQLLPLLAPIVMSYLAKQVLGGRGGQAGGGQVGGGQVGGGAQTQAGGPLGGILGEVLGGVLGGSGGGRGGAGGGVDVGSILTDVLGGLLGGGRRA